MSARHTIFLTGAAGYIGAMLVERFAKRPDVERIVGLDKEPLPEMLRGIEKLVYIQKNTADDWETEVASHRPDIVIHTAWQIRDLYGRAALQHAWNIEGSDRVFDFAIAQAHVTRLIHFSTVASYGSYPENTLEQRFSEDMPFRPSDYRYAEEKRITEMHLKEKYEAARARGRDLVVQIIRPAAITGPRGRFSRIRFGLQSALSGQLKGSPIYRLVSLMTSFVPATPKWARQFVHEDDIVAITELLAFSEQVAGYEAFNASPPGAIVLAKDMARAVGKRIIPMSPALIRFAFFLMWHLTRGRVPTTRGAWKGYSYPILVDGSKITRVHGYRYSMPSTDAFVYTDGAYEAVVPLALRKKRSL